MDRCILCGFLDRLLVADRLPEGEGLLKISCCIRMTLQEGVDPSICTYYCKLLSRDELFNQLHQENGRA